jgi:predicted HicB family RNase H-like nuclease
MWVCGLPMSFVISETARANTQTRAHPVSIPQKLHRCGYTGAMARPTEYEDTRVTKALRIPAELDQQLKSAARERGVSVNVLINAALKDYLHRLLPVDQLLRTS